MQSHKIDIQLNVHEDGEIEWVARVANNKLLKGIIGVGDTLEEATTLLQEALILVNEFFQTEDKIKRLP